jgi:hypothetical protein
MLAHAKPVHACQPESLSRGSISNQVVRSSAPPTALQHYCKVEATDAQQNIFDNHEAHEVSTSGLADLGISGLSDRASKLVWKTVAAEQQAHTVNGACDVGSVHASSPVREKYDVEHTFQGSLHRAGILQDTIKIIAAAQS